VDHVAPSIRKNLALTSPTSVGCSIGIVRSRTQAAKFDLVFFSLRLSNSSLVTMVYNTQNNWSSDRSWVFLRDPTGYVFPLSSSEDGNRSSFRSVVFSSYI
jgi:hypothetical protein